MEREKSISITYFAVLRERRGLSSETIQTTCKTVEDLYIHLSQAHSLLFPLRLMRFSKEGQFVKNDCAIQNGDEIGFLPPFAGG